MNRSLTLTFNLSEARSAVVIDTKVADQAAGRVDDDPTSYVGMDPAQGSLEQGSMPDCAGENKETSLMTILFKRQEVFVKLRNLYRRTGSSVA